LRKLAGSFGWFLGKNDLQVPLYDVVTGGCKDGLHPDRVNENQGAESTLSFSHGSARNAGGQSSKCEPTESWNECLLLNPVISLIESPESLALEEAKVKACAECLCLSVIPAIRSSAVRTGHIN